MSKKAKPKKPKKFVEEEVLGIRALARLGYKTCDIAYMFEVAPGTISRIINRETWAHI
jgi:Holliday junction resolvasome RuvABC DNA-binding subunit